MTDDAFRLPLVFDYVATLSWAVSGAVVAIRRRFDLTGVFIVALLSSTGGGLLRDAVLLNRTPALLTDPVYLPLVGAATAVMTLFTRRLTDVMGRETVSKLVDRIDALGTPAFAVVGMQLAVAQGIPNFGVILVGLTNGVAGGLLRDVVVRDVPALLRPGQFVSLTLLGACGLFLVLRQHYELSRTFAGWVTVAVFFVVRVLTVYFNWQTRSVWNEVDDTGMDQAPGDDP
jgi:uncharacterized membrane protein YeiH